MTDFVQYIRPMGKKMNVSIQRSDEIEALAKDITAKGYTFTVEQLVTGDVSLAVESPNTDEGDIDIELVFKYEMSPEKLGKAVDILVRRVAKKVL